MPSVGAAAVDTASCPAVSVFSAFFVALSARTERKEVAEDDGRIWPFHTPVSDVRPETFDFIVVGGGSAGCVVASRLSEVSEWRVLLLEAGRSEPPEAQVPAIYRNLQMTDMNWRYLSEPQDGYCNNTGCPCPKGKVLGGSSTLNGFVYIRGSPRDYDDWAAVLDDASWSYSGVLPFFLRSENILEEDLALDTTHHAKGGPLPVQRLPSLDPITPYLTKAMADIGLEKSDPNGATQLGYSIAQTTTVGGERASANRAFITPARGRPNLVVRTRAHVDRVLFRGGLAVGVEYRLGDNDGVTKAFVTCEVILSAGVMSTPQILMLSGVGPKEQLESLGIKVVRDLPEVGENLMNHVTSYGVMYQLPADWPGQPANVSSRIDDFTNFVPGGQLSSVGPEEVTAFYKFVEEGDDTDDDRPDINLRFYGVISESSQNPGPGCVTAPVHDPVFYDRVMVTPVVLPADSVGSVRLRSTDPLDPPKILLNLLGDGDGADVRMLVRGLKLAASLEDTAAFREAGLVLIRTPMPGCAHHAFATDDYWHCVAHIYTLNTYHTAGTCRMSRRRGLPLPPGIPPALLAPAAPGVLDPRLRVHGLARLRVVDASAMPLLPRGNPNAPVIMMAEKAAHFIRQDWGRS